MGLSFLIADAAFAFRSGPDWTAARRAVEDFEAEQVPASWFEEWPGAPDELDIAGLRAQLADDLETFASELASPGTDLVVIYTREHCYLVTGGGSAGGDPTSLCDPLWNLGTAGILRAAGSVVWTSMGELDIPPPVGGADRPWSPPPPSRISSSSGFSWFVAEGAPDWEAALPVAGAALEEDLARLRREMKDPFLSASIRVGRSVVWLFARIGRSDDVAASVDRLRAAGVLAAAGLA